jgi:hypothetical protein
MNIRMMEKDVENAPSEGEATPDTTSMLASCQLPAIGVNEVTTSLGNPSAKFRSGFQFLNSSQQHHHYLLHP